MIGLAMSQEPIEPVSQLLKLSKVLERANDFSESDSLYMQIPDNDWNPALLCAVLNPEDSPNPGNILPEFATKHSMRLVLNVPQVQDVIINARQQEPNVDIDDLIIALKYYWKFDAFTEFS